MAIEDAFILLANGNYPKPLATPICDEAFALLKTEVPFREKWRQILRLAAKARQAGGEDASRFAWVIENIYANASAEDIQIMHED